MEVPAVTRDFGSVASCRGDGSMDETMRGSRGDGLASYVYDDANLVTRSFVLRLIVVISCTIC